MSFDGNNGGAVWTPDGKRLIHVSETDARPHAVVAIAADGSGTPQVLFNPADRHVPMAVTPDGRTLVLRCDRGTDLTAEGTRLSGTITTTATAANAAAAPVPIFDGLIEKGRLSFKAISPDGARTITFAATVGVDQLNFTREVSVPPGAPRGREGVFGVLGPATFTATRTD